MWTKLQFAITNSHETKIVTSFLKNKTIKNKLVFPSNFHPILRLIGEDFCIYLCFSYDNKKSFFIEFSYLSNNCLF